MLNETNNTEVIFAPTQNTINLVKDFTSVIIQTLKPETYDGKRGTSVNDWIISVEQYLVALNVNKPMALLLASALLQGHTSAWWNMHIQWAQSKLETPIVKWDDFKTALIQNFQSLDEGKHSLEKLREL